MYDFLLFWWELIALNARKTFSRWRGRRARCQAPSDSGRAFETHCEACALWNEPRRFRRVCPLLASTPDGWRCSVNAADVRPFWGRALGYYGGTLAGLYVVGTIAVFVVLHSAGYDLRYTDVAWPPAWRNADTIRSRYFFAAGQAALAVNRVGEACVDFSLAYNYDPKNYEAGFALTQLWRAGPAGGSDHVYAQLLASHPEHAARTARAWGQALLWRGDFKQLAKLATARLQQDPATRTAWLHALIFSARRLRDPGLLVAARALPNLSGETTALLRLEAAALAGEAAGTARILSVPLTPEASAYARYYQISFLINAGMPGRALELLTQYGAKMAADERAGLSLAALEKLGQRVELQREVTALLATNASPQIYEILAAHLIRYPNAELLRYVASRLSIMPWAEAPEGVAANAALLCAAALDGEHALVDVMRTRMRRATQASLKVLDRAEAAFGPPSLTRAPIGRFVPALPMLPLETVYALFERDEARTRRQP